jgi:predicted short-subunit dehydrogenase-like oxidoreductase (DUF2520 family)
MRELERRHSPPSPRAPALPFRHACVIGAGRLGGLLVRTLSAVDQRVDGPLRRGEVPDPRADLVLLCVPDGELAVAADAVPAGPLLGHCSGATGLSVLGHRPAFSLHPLMTGAGAAIDGSTPEAIGVAAALATRLGLVPVRIAPEDRVAYHAAASVAANYLITVEAAAEAIGATAGLPRAALVPLVRAAVENWAAAGPRRALTGPVARGDEATVDAQRAAVARRTPELLELFDALTVATRALVAHGEAPAPC